MDTREHAENQAIEIIEALARRSKSNSATIENDLTKDSLENKNPSSDNVLQFPSRTILIPDKIDKDLQETQNPNNPKSLKNLLAAQHNLQGMRNRLNDDPVKNKTELAKLDALEKKLNHSILVAKKQENDLAIKVLRTDSRTQILKVGEQLNKIKLMREQMNKSPRFYKDQLQKLDKFESKLLAKVEKVQAKNLQNALRYVVSNPAKYRNEIDRYDELRASLKTNQKENENELKKSQENSKDQSKEKQNDNQISRSSTRSRDDLELSR